MPLGILNKTLIINGVATTTKQLRDSLIDRNLPPPVSPGVKGLSDFQQQMGRVIFNLPNQTESIPLNIENLEIEEKNNRNRLLNFNKYKIENEDEYIVVNPNIDTRNQEDKDYSNQNFGMIGLSSGIGIQNPFTAIDTPRTSNFDTELGNYGSERLEFLLNERVAQSALNETSNRINTDALSLIQGNELIQSNYDITVPSNLIAKGAELLGRLTGIELPVSTIPNGAIGWQEYNTAKANSGKLKDKVNNVLSKLGVVTQTNLTTEKRTDELLKRTGNGQKNALFRHLKLNEYTPNYSSPRLFGLLGDRGSNGRYYIGNEEDTNRGYGVTKVFKSEDFDNKGEGKVTTPTENFVWGGEEVEFPDQTILEKTNYLTEQFSETDVFINQTKKFFKDKLTDKILSRGNAIKDNSGDYARVWLKSTDGTQRDQLEKGYSYNNAIRKSGLFTKDESKPGFSVDSGKASLSVLQSNGTVKSYPYLEESFTTYKKYMLSLENLAWSDNLADLPIQEIGPGDLLSGRKGRIMWFAPYDLSFDETTTANWNETEFLGRGEPIYTYNNTRRSGTFKFKILVDHPRIVNEYRGRQDKELEKFFAGVTSPSELLSKIQSNTNLDNSTKRELEKKANSIVRQSKSSLNTKTVKFNAYFQDGSSFIGDVTSGDYNPEGLNDDAKNISDQKGEIFDIIKNTEEFEIKINIVGNRSNSGEDNELSNNGQGSQKEVGERRGIVMKNFFTNNSEIDTTKMVITTTSNNNNSSAASATADPDSEVAIKDRRVDVTITYFPKGDDTEKPDKEEKDLNQLLQEDLELTNGMFINETTYFDMIADDYPNYFDNISSKLTYFQPGFHSNTPEGLNTRLTFLQQCMRQGPSIYDKAGKGVKPDNLAFGRPPVCILRIGDFIHTKVIIKSLTINYAGGATPQWDLNPEGIGVQPMMADVNMSIEIIGGQSLQGPINRLQNAMSYNFYANTEMYDPRADSIRLNGEGGEIVDGIKLSEIRGEKLSESLTKELKTELPIDQEATRLKAETNAADEAADAQKQRLFIQINEGVEEESYTYNHQGEFSVRVGRNTIQLLSQSGETKNTAVSIRPGLLVDGSGDNRLKVEISNSGQIINEISITDYNKDEPYLVNLWEEYKLFSDTFNTFDSDIMKKISDNESPTNIPPKSKKIKYKKWEKNKEKLEGERDDFIEQNIITIIVDGIFTKDSNVTKKQEFKYKLVPWTTSENQAKYAYYWKLQK